MKRISALVFTVLVGFSVTLASIGEAEAARFGGGKSFGGKSSYANRYRRPFSQPAKPTAQQRQAAAKNQAARDALAKRGGLMGMLGGLALGGLLGAMLFGGAFEGLNFMDFLVFGLLAFMLFRLFAARKTPGAHSAYRPVGAGSGHNYDNGQEAVRESPTSAAFDTDIMFKQGDRSPRVADATFESESADEFVIPPDFDEAAFLEGAIAAYKQLQAAWDDADLAELRGLTTDKVFAELQDQLRVRGGENRTQLLKVDAQLLEVRELAAEMEAAVLFDVIMREEADQRPEQVREVWHFVRPLRSQRPTWFLDGIQQLER